MTGARTGGPGDLDKAPARGPGALLVDRTFGPFFLGSLVSNAGNWFQNLAASVVYDLTRPRGHRREHCFARRRRRRPRGPRPFLPILRT